MSAVEKKRPTSSSMSYSRGILATGAFALAASTTSGQTDWWNNNPGLQDCSWCFSLTTIVILWLVLALVYVWLWYTMIGCMSKESTSTVDFLYGAGIGIFTCIFVALFVYKDISVAYWLAILFLLLLRM